mmetsp:Transcript_44433/g.117465  ORF Transcript_44433/g.117465 Transcript_44433/m.117465 type:complete len:217 (-) Transcript_44433:1556-2206(-)
MSKIQFVVRPGLIGPRHMKSTLLLNDAENTMTFRTNSGRARDCLRSFLRIASQQPQPHPELPAHEIHGVHHTWPHRVLEGECANWAPACCGLIFLGADPEGQTDGSSWVVGCPRKHLGFRLVLLLIDQEGPTGLPYLQLDVCVPGQHHSSSLPDLESVGCPAADTNVPQRPLVDPEHRHPGLLDGAADCLAPERIVHHLQAAIIHPEADHLALLGT